MRRPPRNPFHHSDLGGAYLAFAPRFGDEEEVARDSFSQDSVPARPLRPSAFTRLIDTLRRRRKRKPELPNSQDG
jgi:hypothetical protein